MEYKLTTPCGNCPFRSDKPFYLHPERAEEIADSILNGSPFPCHKTFEYDGPGSADIPGGEQHCAGALITLERTHSDPTLLLTLARLAGVYDPDALNFKAPVYPSVEEWLSNTIDLHHGVHPSQVPATGAQRAESTVSGERVT